MAADAGTRVPLNVSVWYKIRDIAVCGGRVYAEAFASASSLRREPAGVEALELGR